MTLIPNPRYWLVDGRCYLWSDRRNGAGSARNVLCNCECHAIPERFKALNFHADCYSPGAIRPLFLFRRSPHLPCAFLAAQCYTLLTIPCSSSPHPRTFPSGQSPSCLLQYRKSSYMSRKPTRASGKVLKLRQQPRLSVVSLSLALACFGWDGSSNSSPFRP